MIKQTKSTKSMRRLVREMKSLLQNRTSLKVFEWNKEYRNELLDKMDEIEGAIAYIELEFMEKK